MRPHVIIPEPRPLACHPQRPWRPIVPEPPRPSRPAVRTFAAPVVRELPARREQHGSLGAW